MPLTRLRSPEAAARWLGEWVTGTLRTDSRQVQAGDAFIAWPGYANDGRRFVQQALASRAATCLVEDQDIDAFGFDDARIATLPGLKAATGGIANAYFGAPSQALQIVATTGTNGKTSTAWWTAQALTLLGRRSGVIGTLGVGEPGALEYTGLTTPDPVTLHAALRSFFDQGFAACALEASSIGIVEHRLDGTKIDVALFTNFTRDHLDYHGTMAGYWAAKRQLFAWPGLRAASINIDDAQGSMLAAEMSGMDVWTVSAQTGARLQAEQVRYVDGGLAFELREGAATVPVRSTLIGDYNAHNLLVVLGGLRALGVTLADAAAVVPQLTPVPGRLQRVGNEALEVVVDYAHTPDALDKVLQALRPLAAARGGRLWCVFGCGGNRDATKRPLMGAIAERGADLVVATSDNPRDETPDHILAQILAGVVGHDEVAVIADRREAIAYAIGAAVAGDVVLLAGKGHEDYQEVRGQRLPFSDAAEAQAALRLRQPPGRRVASSAPRGGSSQVAEPRVLEAHPMLTLQQAQALLPGSVLVGDGGIAFERVHSDSRSLRAGDLFVALRGEKFDAHDFLAAARDAGAVAALAERGLGGAASGLPGLQVADSLQALQRLAAAWRARFTLPLVAVTGSNGKTTVTQMVASILRAAFGEAAFATQGNLNNHIGLPLTLLRLRDTHRAGVVELGMNHPGEIGELVALAQPTIALVNNAQREHQEFMATVDAVARENGSALTALPADGTAVFPADDVFTPLWREMAGQRQVLTFALDGAADVTAAAATWQADHWAISLQTPAGATTTTLHLAGRHNVKNALAATACALAAVAPLAAVAQGLAAFVPVSGRSQAQRLRLLGREVTLVNDSYNANPDSVLAAIDVLASLPAPRWLVLGDMGEVGNSGPAFHAEVGAAARSKGIDVVWTAGTLSVHAGATRHFADAAALVAALGEAPPAASVLVKGSRFMAMERVVQALQALQTPSVGAA
jgi:murE/murF fusion protein